MTQSLFSGISPTGGRDSVCAAVEAMVERVRSLRLLERRWSLAELKATDEDHEWLLAWARGLTEDTAREASSFGGRVIGGLHFGNAPLFATLLLMLASEVGRRQAPSGEIWPAVREAGFRTGVLDILFPNGYLSTDIREGIEFAACRVLKLRHVFGLERDLQVYFDTIYLQFGFGRLGFEARLPEWLVGAGVPQSVARLLDGHQASDSFRTLWRSLKEYRRGNLSREEALRAVKASPWVLASWTDDLLRCAQSRPNLGYGTDEPDDPDEERPFLRQPIVGWDPMEGPVFQASWADFARLPLESSRYDVLLNGERAGQLLRQADGTYTPDSFQRAPGLNPASGLVLPRSSAQVVAEVSDGARAIECQTLDLWDSSDDVSAYRLSPQPARIDPWANAMLPGNSYALVCAGDLHLEPAPADTRKLSGAGVCGFLLEKGWSPKTRVLLEGSPLWEPLSAGASRRDTTWAEATTVRLMPESVPLRWDTKCRVQIEHAADVQVQYVRLGQRTLACAERRATRTVTEAFAWEPTIAANRLSVAVGVCGRGGFARLKRVAEVDFCGLAVRRGARLSEIRHDGTVSVPEVARNPVRLWQPAHDGGERGWWVEGDRLSGRVRRGERPLSGLAGYGSALSIRQRPFGHDIHEEPLVRAIVDPDFIGPVQPTADKTEFLVTVNRAMEPSADHHIVLCDTDYNLHKLPVTAWRLMEATAEWRCNAPTGVTGPLAWGIAHCGKRIGSLWTAGWAEPLSRVPDESLRRAALAMRWLHLPVLAPDARPHVRAAAERRPAGMLRAWLADTKHLAGLQLPDCGDEWRAVVRDVFDGWTPTNEQAQSIVKALGRQGTVKNERHHMAPALHKLRRVDPRLMAQVLEGELPRIRAQFGAGQARMDVYTFIFGVAGFYSNDGLETRGKQERALRRRRDELLEAAGQQMRVDERFVGSLVARSVEADGRDDDRNVALALNYPPFRDLLAVALLEQMLERVKEWRS